MKIGINARIFDNIQLTGIARSVMEDMKIWADNYKENDYYLFTHKPIHLGFELPPNWHIVCKPLIINKGILWDEFMLPYLIKREDIDVFWGTNFSLPRRIKGVRYYVSVYDLAAFKINGITERKNKIKLILTLKIACKRADKIIVISEATASDLKEVFHIGNDKVVVSYCGGLPSNYQKCKFNDEQVNRSIMILENYFLFISTIEPRKNVETIIHAFEKFINNTNSDMKLILAGKIGWLCDDILKAVNTSPYKERIIMPGFISDEDKSYLLTHATAFVFPSLYEGFGIPILEAFEYGIPVITANNSALPEVAGNAAFYINDVFDSYSLSIQLAKVVNLHEEKKSELRLIMKERLSMFSWEKNAKEIMNLFENKYRKL